MTSISVEQLTFTIEPSVVPFQYEKDAVCVAGWPQGSKVVDVVAHDLPVPASLTWLIEAKDYRVITNPPKPTNLVGLAATIEAKVRDSLAALSVVGGSVHQCSGQSSCLGCQCCSGNACCSSSRTPPSGRP